MPLCMGVNRDLKSSVYGLVSRQNNNNLMGENS